MKCGRWCGEVVVTYSGGYDLPDDAPALLAQACIEAIKTQRNARPDAIQHASRYNMAIAA